MKKAWNALPNGTIRIRKRKNNKLRKVIKIDGEWIFYARYIYELNFRPLKPGEEVHHKDEDTLNDDPYNLEAKTKSKHTSHHMKGNTNNLGKNWSKETKNKMSLSHYGIYPSKETRKKLSAVKTGENNGMFGKHHSKESKIKMGISKLRENLSPRTRKKLSAATSGENNPSAILTWKKVKKIRHLRFWKNYSYEELMKIFNISKSGINNVLQGYAWNPNDLTKEELKIKSKILRLPV